MREYVGNVVIESRENIERELLEMRKFVAELQKSNSDGYIERVFYDSKSQCCTLHFTDHFDDLDPVEKKFIFSAAKQHLSQFDWDGGVEHGAPLLGPTNSSKRRPLRGAA